MFERDKRNSYICVQKVDEATGLLLEEQMTLKELLEEFKRINNNIKWETSSNR